MCVLLENNIKQTIILDSAILLKCYWKITSKYVRKMIKPDNALLLKCVCVIEKQHQTKDNTGICDATKYYICVIGK